MTAELAPLPTSRRTASWSGRASRLRREQIIGRSPAANSPVQRLWASLVDVLAEIDGPSAALLSTASGDPVAVHGLAGGEAARVARQNRVLFGADRARQATSTVETVELTVGLRHTVIASVPSPDGAGHLLSVTAQGVSMPVLEAWTRRLAEDIHGALAPAS